MSARSETSFQAPVSFCPDDYFRALQSYLQSGGESALQRAYEIGRAALTAGTGLLPIARAHHLALETLLQHDDALAQPRETLAAASVFFMECISSYEMTYSGFREANTALRHFNELLEKEARRIAHVLHDESGQLLVAVYIALQKMAEEAPSTRTPVAKVIELLDQIEIQLRRLAHELAPALLDELGLVPALRYLAEGLTQRTRLRITIDDVPGERLPRSVEVTLYRAVKESLHNVLKHAQATEVSVLFQREPDSIYCRIRDNGMGCDVEALRSRQGEQGFGLIGMRERVGSTGGTLQINSSAGSGMELAIHIPVEN